MQFALLQNQNIVPGTRWVYRIDTDQIPRPFYVAQIREFDSGTQARRFSQAHNGVVVPDKDLVLVFAGVMNATRCPISINYDIEIPDFLNAAAQWLANQPGITN